VVTVMKLMTIISILVLCSSLVSAAPKSESPLTKARGEYMDMLFKATDDFDLVSKKAHSKFLLQLKVLEQESRQKNDLESADEILKEIQAKEAEGPPTFGGTTLKTKSLVLARLKGTWEVKFSNKTSHFRRIELDGSVNGTEGVLKVENGQITITYAKVIERLIIAENKVIFEHFNPKSSYSPTETAPVVGIGTRKAE